MGKLTIKIRKSAALTCMLQVLLLLSSSAEAAKTERTENSKVLRGMGRIYMARGQYEKAEFLIRKAVDAVNAPGTETGEKAICMIDMATLYSYQERFAESEEYFREGLQLQTAAIGRDHPYVAHTLRNLSAVYKKQKRLDDAQAVLDKAFAIMLRTHQPENRILTPFVIDRIALRAAQGRFTEAEDLYTQLLEKVKTDFGSNHIYMAQVQEGLAGVYLETGRFAEARGLMEKSLSTQERIYGRGHRLLVSSYLLGARLCRAQQDRKGMQEYFDRAVATLGSRNDITAAARLYSQIEDIRTHQLIAAVENKTEEEAG